MKKHLSKFDSVAEATAFKGELVAPHVSYVEDGLAFSGNFEVGTPVKISLNAEGKLEISVAQAPALGPANNEIWYTTSDGKKSNLHTYGSTSVIENHTYENGKGIITYNSSDICISGDDNEERSFFDGSPYDGYNDKITTIYLSKGVTCISWYAFCYLPNLKSIHYAGTIDEWNKNVYLPNGSSYMDTLSDCRYINCIDGDVEIFSIM